MATNPNPKPKPNPIPNPNPNTQTKALEDVKFAPGSGLYAGGLVACGGHERSIDVYEVVPDGSSGEHRVTLQLRSRCKGPLTLTLTRTPTPTLSLTLTPPLQVRGVRRVRHTTRRLAGGGAGGGTLTRTLTLTLTLP